MGSPRPTPGARRCRGTPRARAAIHNRDDDALRAYQQPGLGHHRNPLPSMSRSRRRTALTAPHPTGTHRCPPSASSDNFKALLTLFKVLFIFPRWYLLPPISVSPVFSSFGRNLPPARLGAAFPNNPDHRQPLGGKTGSGHGPGPTFPGSRQGTWGSWVPPTEDVQIIIPGRRGRPIFMVGFWAFLPKLPAVTKGIPLHSFFPPLIDMLNPAGSSRLT
ncbi:hypothetical protein HKD37_U058846 [Glycine soja]